MVCCYYWSLSFFVTNFFQTMTVHAYGPKYALPTHNVVVRGGTPNAFIVKLKLS
jgi:hypothetical protein